MVRERASGRRRDLLDSQDSLVYLAQQTGGFAVLNGNDLVAGMARVIDDTRGYYLLGFDTSIPTNERWDPNDIRIHVKRPGLTVRARRGLFGPAEKERPRDATPADPLVAATLSPFATGAIDVRLTTLFAHDKTAGSYVRTLFFIDPAGLTFAVGADGRHEADLSLLLLAVGDNGQTSAQVRIEVPLRLNDDDYALMRQRGLLYSARLGIKEAGGYQIRAAVQDDRSKAIGTSAQFVEVPKVGKDVVALSGVLMTDLTSAIGGAPGEPAIATAIRTDALADGVLGEPAIKIFKPGSEVVYAFEIYDGRGKRKDGFSTRATLIRDGKAFYTTPPAPIGAAPSDAKPVGSVPVGGKLSLGRGLPRGTYTLQVSVAPQSGKGRDRPASQWVDFEAAHGRGGRQQGRARDPVGGLRGALMRIDAKLGIAATALALAACLLAPGVTARPGAQAPVAQAPGGQPTFRAGTRLATFDAVVTDRKGRHVTDLAPADFEVVERGKRQTVRQVAYVHAVRPDGAPTAVAGADAPAAPAPAMPGAPGLPSREQTGRVMAIVVDDLRMSFRSTVDVRTMLNRYVDRQLRPGDLVAIIRTAGGAGALQQFTTDRRLLKAAIERVRWSARVWPFNPSGPWEEQRRRAGRSLRARRHAGGLAWRPGVRRARRPGAAGTQDRGVRVGGFLPGHARQPAERRPARSRPRHRHRQPGRRRHVHHRSAGAREPSHG